MPKKGCSYLCIFRGNNGKQRSSWKRRWITPWLGFQTSWHQKPPAKQAALQICLQLIPQTQVLPVNYLKTMDVSILSFPFTFFLVGLVFSKFQVSTTSQESSYLAPSSYLPRSVGFPHEHLHPARANPNASTYSVHTISGPHARRWSLSNLQAASHELLSGTPGNKGILGLIFLGKPKIRPTWWLWNHSFPTKKHHVQRSLATKSETVSFFLFQPPALALKHISLAITTFSPS